MTIEEAATNHHHHHHASEHILDWLEDSVPFFSSFLDDPYATNTAAASPHMINCYQLWDESQDNLGHQDLINNRSTITSLHSPPIAATSTGSAPPKTDISIIQSQASDLPKKRKTPHDNEITKISQNPSGKNQTNRQAAVKKSVGGNRRNSGKANGNNNSNNGNSKEGRWAEQLLNPCATSITSGDLPKVQHLLYVLRELGSVSGDSNHRLAAHGYRALTHHLSSSTSSSSTATSPITFATTNPRLFQQSLIKFHEVSPWFAFPNNIANSSILQILSEDPDRSKNLHIVDIGVSHGVQWPTLLEALTRRSGGPPPLVRLTVIGPTVDKGPMEPPFSIAPPGDNVSSRLLTFAKSMNINLQINRLDNRPLQTLDAHAIDKSSPDEVLIVCVQFRAHHLNHNTPDERTEFLKMLRKMEPKGVILSENNMECSCNNCGEFDTGFARRVEWLWRFLDSTSSAFKGRESDERKVMEGEAAKALTNKGEMNEEKEKWCERMRKVGFIREVFGEDVIDGGRALLRRYDSNWEMIFDEKDGCVGLWWKGQPVIFCSLWKLAVKPEDS